MKQPRRLPRFLLTMVGTLLVALAGTAGWYRFRYLGGTVLYWVVRARRTT
jgi:hypothetical protein